MIGRIIENYRITGVLGEGGMGVVYQAVDTRLERQVAIKVMHPHLAAQQQFQKRFLQEARAAANLDHSNIVRVLAFNHIDGQLFLVMELVSGGSLREYMHLQEANAPLVDMIEAIDSISQIADALHYAHQQGMVHRDIKPDNVLVKPNTSGEPGIRIILTDFGLAQLADSAINSMAGTAVGTFPYMSPEQCNGYRVDARTDIYAMGVMLYELLTGQLPFQPRSFPEAIRMHTKESYPPASELRPDLPRELEQIVNRALEKDPNSRYQTANEMARDLQRARQVILNRSKPGAPEPEPAQPAIPMRTIGQFYITHASNPPQTVNLDRDVTIIGRDDDRELVLKGPKISRSHASIERSFDEQYRITDLGSTNGTWLNDELLPARLSQPLQVGSLVRIGEYTLEFRSSSVPVTPAAPPSSAPGPSAAAPRPAVTSMPDANPMQSFVVSPSQMPSRPASSSPDTRNFPNVNKLDQDQIGVVLSQKKVDVEPGSRSTLAIEIINQSHLVDHFSVRVINLPADWYTVPNDALYLLPEQRDTSSVTFHPPRNSSSRVGSHAFEIRIEARAQGTKSVGGQGMINISPFHNFVIDLQPLRIRGRGVGELAVQNNGNTPDTYVINGRDREQMLEYDFSQKQLMLEPGQTEYVSVRLKSKERPWFGRPRTFPFELSVQAPDTKLPPQGQQAEYVAGPRIPWWALALLLIPLVACGLLAAFLLSNLNQTRDTSATGTYIAQVTLAVVQITQTAEADPDEDGLPTWREIELGTDPFNPDTDGDGLNDGEEILVYGTNPTMRDSDGDGLSDGEEVLVLGTNPLDRDSDGDGLPDNVDPNPLGRSTPTPLPTDTPTPTATETPLPIASSCIGSMPPRLQKNAPGQVEAGGVANRLRAEPRVGAEVVNLMQPGARFVVLDGPVCDEEDFLMWWLVRYQGQEGWSAESNREEYFLEPITE